MCHPRQRCNHNQRATIVESASPSNYVSASCRESSLRGFHRWSRSLCKRRERVSIFVHDLIGDLYRLREIRIVGQHLEAAAGKLDDVQRLAALEIEAPHK